MFSQPVTRLTHYESGKIITLIGKVTTANFSSGPSPDHGLVSLLVSFS